MAEMTRELMKQRTKQFALRIVRLVSSLPRTLEARTIGGQLLRSGTSVGANYRAACRARSRAEFISRLGVVKEEADECGFWLELLAETGIMKPDLLGELMKEADEIVAIIVATRKTSRGAQTMTKAATQPVPLRSGSDANEAIGQSLT